MRALTLDSAVAAPRPRNLSIIANMTISWSMAGGIAAGVLIAALVFTSRLHSMGLIPVTAIVALTGSMLGSVHGAVLGHLGRAEPNARLSLRHWALVLALACSGAAFAVPFAIWLAVGAMAAASGESSGTVGLLIAIPLTLMIFAWATMNGWDAFEVAYSRWPQKRLGTLLVAGAFAVLSAFMLLLRGAIPGTEIRLSPAAALMLVAIAVLWIVSPAVIVALSIAGRARH